MYKFRLFINKIHYMRIFSANYEILFNVPWFHQYEFYIFRTMHHQIIVTHCFKNKNMNTNTRTINSLKYIFLTLFIIRMKNGRVFLKMTQSGYLPQNTPLCNSYKSNSEYLKPFCTLTGTSYTARFVSSLPTIPPGTAQFGAGFFCTYWRDVLRRQRKQVPNSTFVKLIGNSNDVNTNINGID